MNIIKLSAIGSTNDYLKDISKELLLEDGTLVIAERQTKGRGQMGEGWYSKAGESLSFSMFKRFFGITVDTQPVINFIVALSVKDALEEMGIEHISIKWPNDILADSKKLCGILIENKVKQDQVVSSVIGIGLNVNNEKFENLPRATSMRLVSHKTFDRLTVMKLIAQKILDRAEKMHSGSFQLLRAEFEQALFRKDMVTVFEYTDGKRFNGIVRGVSPSGELLLEKEDETIRKFQLKEIKMLY